MSLELSATAHITEGNLVQVLFGVENHTEDSVSIGTMMSQLYSVHAYSESVDAYGESVGYAAAPHHLKLPAGEAVVFGRKFKAEYPEFEHIDTDDIQFNPLRSDITEEVEVDVTVYLRDSEENLTDSIAFVPADLPLGRTDSVTDSLVDLPQTENEIQMG